MTRNVTLVCGPPCAGKNTYIAQHASPDATIVDLDDIARELGSPRQWLHAPRYWRPAQDIWWRRAAQLDGEAYAIRSVPAAADRQRVAEHVRADHVIVLLPPEAELYARAQARPDPHRTRGAIAQWLRSYTTRPGDLIVGGGSMPGPRANGHRYRMARAAVLQASDICHLCGHAGADQADHLTPRSVDGTRDVADPTNLAPVHGVHGCPTCHVKCNQSRGNRMVMPRRPQSCDW